MSALPPGGVPRAGARARNRAVVGVLVRAVCRVLVWLVAAVGFTVGFVDELVTARLGVAPVVPRLRLWHRRLVTEWRAYRAGAVEGEVMDGVWR